MARSFLITGLGRSGTKFLAGVMNRSRVWTVAHEPNDQEPLLLTHVRDPLRFQTPFYGEVNSRMRWVANELGAGQLGVIIRNPYEHCVSSYNKNRRLVEIEHPNANKSLRPGHYEDGLRKLHQYIQAGATTIRFERMTSSPEYLESVLRAFGVTDVPVAADMPSQKKNVNPHRSINTFSQMPRKHQKFFKDQFLWFWELYYADNIEEDLNVPNPVQGPDVPC